MATGQFYPPERVPAAFPATLPTHQADQELEPPLPPPRTPPPDALPSTHSAPSATATAAQLIRTAIGPSSSLDFPQITEICERLEAVPSETKKAVSVLMAALRDPNGPLRVKLKALTIANEMMYNPGVVEAFRATKGASEVLSVLRTTRSDELGPATAENVRMLATEVDRVCFGAGAPLKPHGFRAFGKAMSMNLDKARHKAEKTLEAAWCNMEKTLEKAERAANNLMLEAERQIVGTFDAPLSPQGTQSAKERRAVEDCTLSQEEKELQWALRASLIEAKKQKGPEKAVLGTTTSSPGSSRPVRADHSLKGPMDQVIARIQEAESRAATAEKAIILQAAREAKASSRDEQILERIEESQVLVATLASQVEEVQAHLARQESRLQQLEAARLLPSSPVPRSENEEVQRLRQRIAELEAEVAQAQWKEGGSDCSCAAESS